MKTEKVNISSIFYFISRHEIFQHEKNFSRFIVAILYKCALLLHLPDCITIARIKRALFKTGENWLSIDHTTPFYSAEHKMIYIFWDLWLFMNWGQLKTEHEQWWYDIFYVFIFIILFALPTVGLFFLYIWFQHLFKCLTKYPTFCIDYSMEKVKQKWIN